MKLVSNIYIYNFVFDWSIQEQLVMMNLLQKKDESEKSVYHCESLDQDKWGARGKTGKCNHIIMYLSIPFIFML
jgi:hypothetical protein